jgi:PHD/YefM family antitoxin component YafN of YafNO toxin-antitoxin module
MLELKPQIIKKNGRNEFVILTWEEFEAVREAIEDAEDLPILEQAIEEHKGEPGIPQDEIARRYGVRPKE